MLQSLNVVAFFLARSPFMACANTLIFRHGYYVKASHKAYEIIKFYEGLRLTSYLCEADKWTIGFGSRRGVVEGLTITQEEANQRLANDIARVERGLNVLIDVEINQHEFDALVSWAFNIGLTEAATSTLMRKLNNGEPGVSDEILRWNKVRKGPEQDLVVSNGLVSRRITEKNLFDTLTT